MYTHENVLLDIAHQRMAEFHYESARDAMAKEAKRSKFSWFKRLNETAPHSRNEATAEWVESARTARLRSI